MNDEKPLVIIVLVLGLASAFLFPHLIERRWPQLYDKAQRIGIWLYLASMAAVVFLPDTAIF